MIELLPMERVDVENVATPSERVPVPSSAEPFKNSMVPEGVPAPGLTAATVAVRVTTWPATDGLGLVVSVVVDDACATVTVTAADVLVAKFVSPW